MTQVKRLNLIVMLAVAMFVLGIIIGVSALVAANAAQAQITCSTGQWNAKYYAGTLYQTFRQERCEAQGTSYRLEKDWGSGSITPLSRSDQASVTWKGTFGFGTESAEWEFTAITDDGSSVYVDDRPVIQDWRDKAASPVTGRISLGPGQHVVTVDYYENTGLASAKVKWEKVGITPPPPTDSDSDGVPDANDQCPGTAPGTPVDANGCAVQVPPTDCPSTAPSGYTTSSGSPSDEIATGQDVFIPSGTYSAGTMSLASNQDVVGTGKNSVTINNTGGNGANVQNSGASLRCLRVQGPGKAAGTTGIIAGSVSNSRLAGLDVRGFKFGIHARSLPTPDMDILDSNFSGYDYGFYGGLRDSLVLDNVFNTTGGYAGMEFQSFNNVEMAGNTFTGGVVAAKGLADYPFSEAGFNGWNVHGNTASGFSEEGISTDTRANQPQNTMREIDEVSSASGNTVVLQDGGWSGSQYGDGNHYMSFWEGQCRGVPIKITAQAGRTFTLQNPPCLPSVNDRAMVGVPFLNITFNNNTVDASNGLRGLDFWGYTYNTSVTNNRVEGPNTNGDPNKKAIGLISLAGYTTAGASIPAPCGKAAAVDNITVTGNTDINGSLKASDAVFVSTNKWGCIPYYSPRLNTISGNTLPKVTQDIQW